MRHPNKILLAAAILGMAASVSAATIITHDSGTGTNVDIPNTFGDNVTAGTTDYTVSSGTYGVTGTPNVDLTWSSAGGSGGQTNHWQSYGTSTYYLATAGALQMDGDAVGATYSILFTPTAQTSVQLNSFNFNNDSGSAGVAVNRDYFFTVNLVDTTTLANVFTTTLTFNPTVNSTIGAATVTLNTLGTTGHALRLDIVRNSTGTATSGASAGSGNDIYIDNLSFDQTVAAVPEPSTYGLLGAGALAAVAAVRRRRRSEKTA